jgi:hypothetical protein
LRRLIGSHRNPVQRSRSFAKYLGKLWAGKMNLFSVIVSPPPLLNPCIFNPKGLSKSHRIELEAGVKAKID